MHRLVKADPLEMQGVRPVRPVRPAALVALRAMPVTLLVTWALLRARLAALEALALLPVTPALLRARLARPVVLVLLLARRGIRPDRRAGTKVDLMIETLMGLNVVDPDRYAQYRAHMKPLLEAHGGSFGLDLWVAEVLISPVAQPFNRVFTLRFPSIERREAFFANPEYLAIRRTFFEPSVAASTELGRLQSSS